MTYSSENFTQTLKISYDRFDILSLSLSLSAEAASASSWTGWAMSSLTSKFYKSSATSGIAAQAPPSTAAGATPTTGSVDTKRGEQKRMYDCVDLCFSYSTKGHGNIVSLSSLCVIQRLVV